MINTNIKFKGKIPPQINSMPFESGNGTNLFIIIIAVLIAGIAIYALIKNKNKEKEK